jgi:hypothetical protein
MRRDTERVVYLRKSKASGGRSSRTMQMQKVRIQGTSYQQVLNDRYRQ